MKTQTEALNLIHEQLQKLWLLGDKAAELANPALDAIKEALAQQSNEQVEPVAKDQWWVKGLDGLWGSSDYVVTLDTRRAAKTALSVIFDTHPPVPTAQPEQEPVAWATRMGEYAHIHWGAKRPEYPMVYEVPLYTTPPQRTWVGLTPDEIRGISLASGESLFSAIMFTHDKLKEKNT